MQNSLLHIENLNIEFDDFKLKDINLSVKEGEYFVLLGESGAGKSVILETIAGMIHPAKGNIFLNKKNITKEKIHKRKIGLVFQDYAVFPNMNVRKNVEYALRNSRLNKIEKKRWVMECTELMNISHLLHRMPTTLSGGELQRVAFARTLVAKPLCLLLDEPLSAVDVHLKDDLRMLLRKINRKGQTIIHVTHSYNEAVSLAHRIAIIENGEIVQTGTPSEIFTHPKTKFTAKLSGTKNFFNAVIQEKGTAICENKVEIKLLQQLENKKGFVSFRPEDVVVSKQPLDSSLTNHLQGKVIDIIPSMNGIEIVANAGITIHSKISFASFEEMQIDTGSTITLSFKATAVKFIAVE